MNLKEPFVITISREIGSGGHTVGRILAEESARALIKDIDQTRENYIQR